MKKRFYIFNICNADGKPRHKDPFANRRVVNFDYIVSITPEPSLVDSVIYIDLGDNGFWSPISFDEAIKVLEQL